MSAQFSAPERFQTRGLAQATVACALASCRADQNARWGVAASKAMDLRGPVRAGAGPLQSGFSGPGAGSLYSPSDKIVSPGGTIYTVQRLLGAAQRQPHNECRQSR